MTTLINRKVLLEACSPIFQAKRFRAKINIQRPRKPHFERQRFMDVAEPYYINPKKDIPLVDLCTKDVKRWGKDKQENPFQQIIAKELRRWFESSRLIGFCHLNPMNDDHKLKAFITFKKQNMHFKSYGKETLSLAIKGTKFETALDFYVSQNMLIFSPEPEIKKMLKVLKKFPQLVLLAGIYEDRFLSKDELTYYSQIPNIQTAQAGLVQTLHSMGGNIVSQLQTHQNVLVSQLQERVKQLEDENK